MERGGRSRVAALVALVIVGQHPGGTEGPRGSVVVLGLLAVTLGYVLSGRNN